MSIIEVHKYISVLTDNCAERKSGFQKRINKYNSYLSEEMADKIKTVRTEWNNIGWLRDAITNASSKTFGSFVDLKREQLTMMTQVESFTFAVKLLAEVENMLTLLKLNSIEPFMKVLSEFAISMKQLADEKCKLSDADDQSLLGEVIKEYDPKFVRNTVVGFLKDQKRQNDYATALRMRIIESVGTSEVSFSSLGKKVNAGTLRSVAQSYLTFNGSEEGQGSPETAANHQKIIQLSLPLYEENEDWRNEFIEAFGNSGNIPFDKDKDKSDNFKSNQIVVVTAHSGFPLRYVDNLRVLKEKYDVLVRNEVNRMVVHTETFNEPLPALYSRSKEESKKDLLPVILLAYTIDGIITTRTDEDGNEFKAFAGEKNMMGRVSRWIPVGNNILETLDELCKITRAADATTLKKSIKNELDQNYRNNDKKKELMLKMGDTLEKVILPLVGSESNKTYIEFNKAGEDLCDRNLNL